MAKLVRWFKRLLCLLFGCPLAAKNIESCYEDRTMMYTLRNRCIRCGAEYRSVISKIDLLEHEPIRWEYYNG